MFEEAVAVGIQLFLPYYFMHAATNGVAPICSTANQAKVLLIAEYKSYMFGLFKFMLLGLSGEHIVYKKQVPRARLWNHPEKNPPHIIMGRYS